MIIILALILLSSGMRRISDITGFVVNGQNYSEINLSTYTKAVCEENENGIYCHDELFLRCNGRDEMIGSSFVKCGNIEHEVELPEGYAVFSSEWEDPRLE